MKKTITGKFETLDMAEFAARGLKNNYSDITNIKIKYKNHSQAVFHDQPHDHDIPNAMVASAGFYTASGSVGGVAPSMVPPLFFNRLDTDEHRNDNEMERSTESRIIVKAEEQSTGSIAAKLRCLGGYDIEVF